MLIFFLWALSANASVYGGKDPLAITQAEIFRRTQQLLDAYASGDEAPFRMYIADDAMFFDEQDMDKTQLLESIRALPEGYSGTITIENKKTRSGPNSIITAFDAKETETVFGQVLHARYHMTYTWLYRGNRWQIVAGETHRYYEDPAPGSVALSPLDDYVGVYQLSPGMRMAVTRDGEHLTAQRGSQKPRKIVPEAPDLFFRSGIEGRFLFHRDTSGRVDELIDRRNNEDLLWKKIS